MRPFTATEAQAALSHHSRVALGESRGDAFMDGGRLCRLKYFLIRRARPPIPVTNQQLFKSPISNSKLKVKILPLQVHAANDVVHHFQGHRL